MERCVCPLKVHLLLLLLLPQLPATIPGDHARHPVLLYVLALQETCSGISAR